MVGFDGCGSADIEALANIFEETEEGEAEATKKTSKHLSSKINQFKLVFLFDKFTLLGEFFANTGSLTAEELR